MKVLAFLYEHALFASSKENQTREQGTESVSASRKWVDDIRVVSRGVVSTATCNFLVFSSSFVAHAGEVPCKRGLTMLLRREKYSAKVTENTCFFFPENPQSRCWGSHTLP